MAMKRQNLLILAVIAFAAVAAGIAYERQQQKAQDIADNSAVQTTVTQFGATMQKVSLSAPDALQEIALNYAPYASSSVIKAWQANRSFAPGRGLSGLWPSGIDITTVAKEGGTYVVEGQVVEMDSGEVSHSGIAAEFPVSLTLAKYRSAWLIYDYQAGPTSVFTSATTTATTSAAQ